MFKGVPKFVATTKKQPELGNDPYSNLTWQEAHQGKADLTALGPSQDRKRTVGGVARRTAQRRNNYARAGYYRYFSFITMMSLGHQVKNNTTAHVEVSKNDPDSKKFEHFTLYGLIVRPLGLVRTLKAANVDISQGSKYPPDICQKNAEIPELEK
ncbi:hypothetical protein CPB84DRAFT_1918456 [Gymnopilus junonius]|uniref:Uncharacterized protein n=1 Tax=Gymnopilus junonius TaxID=109634 RepID=A0A9P5NPR2_GYMJU|nr:hypothetical protein CPB84DRAFT_1918456 [Gymnopilus junonius]